LEGSEQKHTHLLSLFLVLDKWTQLSVLSEIFDCSEQTHAPIILLL
jgi:hypothetical protein